MIEPKAGDRVGLPNGQSGVVVAVFDRETLGRYARVDLGGVHGLYPIAQLTPEFDALDTADSLEEEER